MTTSVRLAVDIGGTFTDAVLEAGSTRQTIKVLTTPNNPAKSFMTSINLLMQELAGHLNQEVQILIFWPGILEPEK